MVYAVRMDMFRCFVSHTSGEGAFHEDPQVTEVHVMSWRTNDATLAALEIVASRGRCPVAVEVDWTDF